MKCRANSCAPSLRPTPRKLKRRAATPWCCSALAARNTTFNRATYALGRVVMSVSRSVDSLIWALIFIIVVGPGSLAGALAVAVRSIGFVSKLFAEGIEEIDRGQVEAITATGAGRFKVLLYGIVPQIRPVFAGVTIYRWDINIRESTVLGIVGIDGGLVNSMLGGALGVPERDLERMLDEPGRLL